MTSVCGGGGGDFIYIKSQSYSHPSLDDLEKQNLTFELWV